MAGVPLPKGTMLLGARGTLDFELHGATDKVNLAPVTVEGQPFQQALRADVKEAGGSEWSVQLQTKKIGRAHV